MKLIKYLETKKISLLQASQELGFPYESVRRYSLGLVIPRPEQMKQIVEWSGGDIQPNDFYDLGD